MGLLTDHPVYEKPKFDKERIVQEIKDSLIGYPEWDWLTTPDYEFDLILVRSKKIREEIVNDSNPMMSYKNVALKSYQIALGIFVSQGSYDTQDCNIAQVHIESSRELFNILKEYD